MRIKNRLIASAALAGSIAFSGSATAGPNPYADCGIGAAIFQDIHWAAAISNVIWDLGTTAITSATASPETCSGAKVETAKFILENYDNLAEQTAKGSGEHLTAMLNVMGCDAAAHGDIVMSVRQDMAPIVGNSQYSAQTTLEKASDMYDVVNQNITHSYSGSCSVI